MSIYTKRGDKGKTDLFDYKKGEAIRICKSDKRFITIGSLDELNSILGVIKSFLEEKRDITFIEKIQKDLFLINSNIAGVKKVRFSKNKVKYLEEKIDFLEKKLPKINNFIIPGGNLSSSFFHLARAVIRRAERSMVRYKEKKEVSENILAFINRLSDLFFILARWENFSKGEKEIFWEK